jgi:hypothetical protein
LETGLASIQQKAVGETYGNPINSLCYVEKMFKSGIISVANKVGLSSDDVDPLALEENTGTALEMELQKREKQLDAPDEIELTDKEQALFVAGMKSLSKLVIKMEPLPESGSENEWAVMLSSLSVAVCRDLQYCAVFKEDDELSV